MSNIARKSGIRPKKRKFHNNRFTNNNTDNDLNTSASNKKLNSEELPPKSEELERKPSFSGYRLIDIDILFSFMEGNLSCKSCEEDISVTESSFHGLSSRFYVQCQCSVKNFNSCTMVGKNKNVAEINRRFVYSMHQLGKGKAGMDTFCATMLLPSPVKQKSYSKIVDKILQATEEVVQKSMKAGSCPSRIHSFKFVFICYSK